MQQENIEILQNETSKSVEEVQHSVFVVGKRGAWEESNFDVLGEKRIGNIK